VIERDAPEPVYRQLADVLRTQIETGQLPPRTRVPSLGALAAEYGIAVTTVQQAVKLLKSEGLIIGVPGKGTFVAER
jgi:DNA-binding GntR family transcriptional regulator